jgi:hypothetical protein
MFRNMFRKMILADFILAAMFTVGFQRARAQDSTPAKSTPAAEKIVNAYRLDFSVNEVEDGRKVNSRQYSMDLNSESSNELKIGTRVPMEVKEGEFQYLDVGTNVWSRLEDHTGQINLVVRAEMSNFAIPDQSQDHNARPLIRQVKIDGSTVATPGKPMLIGSVDDPNSKKQFQLEVTVTKLR